MANKHNAGGCKCCNEACACVNLPRSFFGHSSLILTGSSGSRVLYPQRPDASWPLEPSYTWPGLFGTSARTIDDGGCSFSQVANYSIGEYGGPGSDFQGVTDPNDFYNFGDLTIPVNLPSIFQNASVSVTVEYFCFPTKSFQVSFILYYPLTGFSSSGGFTKVVSGDTYSYGFNTNSFSYRVIGALNKPSITLTPAIWSPLPFSDYLAIGGSASYTATVS